MRLTPKPAILKWENLEFSELQQRFVDIWNNINDMNSFPEGSVIFQGKEGLAEDVDAFFYDKDTNTLTVENLILKGGLVLGVVTKTADYSIDATDYTIIADGSSTTVTITLPGVPVTGQIFVIKCSDSTNTVTVDRNGKTIDGDASDVVLIKDESIQVQYDGAGWQII